MACPEPGPEECPKMNPLPSSLLRMLWLVWLQCSEKCHHFDKCCTAMLLELWEILLRLLWIQWFQTVCIVEEVKFPVHIKIGAII